MKIKICPLPFTNHEYERSSASKELRSFKMSWFLNFPVALDTLTWFPIMFETFSIWAFSWWDQCYNNIAGFNNKHKTTPQVNICSKKVWKKLDHGHFKYLFQILDSSPAFLSDINITQYVALYNMWKIVLPYGSALLTDIKLWPPFLLFRYLVT